MKVYENGSVDLNCFPLVKDFHILKTSWKCGATPYSFFQRLIFLASYIWSFSYSTSFSFRMGFWDLLHLSPFPCSSKSRTKVLRIPNRIFGGSGDEFHSCITLSHPFITYTILFIHKRTCLYFLPICGGFPLSKESCPFET